MVLNLILSFTPLSFLRTKMQYITKLVKTIWVVDRQSKRLLSVPRTQFHILISPLYIYIYITLLDLTYTPSKVCQCVYVRASRLYSSLSLISMYYYSYFSVINRIAVLPRKVRFPLALQQTVLHLDMSHISYHQRTQYIVKE